MKIISGAAITEAVSRLCIRANRVLPSSVLRAMENAAVSEADPTARKTLRELIQNAHIAEREDLPICQDTGFACVFLDIGQEVHIEGDIAEAVNLGVSRGYTSGYLRASIVSDPLRRENTRDNTPAVLYTRSVPGSAIVITVAPKGCGSENKSRIKMLNPADGRDGVLDFVIESVRLAGASACPPMVVGIGIGGTFDTCAQNAKRALLRELGEANPDPYYMDLEAEILGRINELGIGPSGFGGKTTALGVSIIPAPTHIASLPAAVNISCHALRHASEIIS